jgi:DNA-binding NarL/FixJ family response regulator
MPTHDAVKTRIYIVDDHALIRRGLATLIQGEPDMEICGEGEDAATGLQDIIKLQPDLVIADISLKGNSGLELIKNIRAFNPKIQVLVLSMHHESVYALRVLKAGARAYVMKQDVVKKIIEAIRRIRSGHLYVSDEVAGQMLNRIVGGNDRDNASPVSILSDRELEIVNLIGSGMLTREIASQLHLSVKTVETHRAHIKEKLNLSNGTQLVQFCVRWIDENNARQDSRSASDASHVE